MDQRRNLRLLFLTLAFSCLVAGRCLPALGASRVTAKPAVFPAAEVVGYFTDFDKLATGPKVPILNAGFTSVHITDITTVNLAALDILFIDETCSDDISSELRARMPDIENWVAQGGRLIVHDRGVGFNHPNPLLPGFPYTESTREETSEVDVIAPGDTLVTQGPFGFIGDRALDGGSSSAHGFVDRDLLPLDAEPILSVGGFPDRVVDFAYPLERGLVYYSGIPLDCYLAGGDCEDHPLAPTFQDIYTPNVLSYVGSFSGPQRVLRVENSVGGEACGVTLDVPVTFGAIGNENGLAFSLNFNPALLSAPQVVAGGDAGNAALFVNASQAANGKIGVALILSEDETFAPGKNQLVTVRFTSHPVATNQSTVITFGDQPTIRETIDAAASALKARYRSGTLSLVAGFEGDVAPRPAGNGLLTLADWSQSGRYAAGLDVPGSPGEFQRADCAPGATCGNGVLNLFDWVQAGRYVAGLDPWRRVGGPGAFVPGPPFLPVPFNPLANRALTIAGASSSSSGATITVPVDFMAQGDENALSFGLSFDASMLTYDGASISSGATGAILIANTNLAASGRIGFALALAPGQTFAPGRSQLINVRFSAVPATACAVTPMNFSDAPLVRLVSDAQAQTLGATYVNGTATVAPGAPLRLIAVPPSGGSGLTLFIGSADGSPLPPARAANIRLQAAANLSPPDTAWLPVTNVLVLVGGQLRVTGLNITNPPLRFFRAVECQGVGGE